MLGSCKRDGLGALVVSVIIGVAGAVSALLIWIIVLAPDPDHFTHQFFGFFWFDFREFLKNGESLFFLFNLEEELGGEGNILKANGRIDSSQPLLIGPGAEEVAGWNSRSSA